MHFGKCPQRFGTMTQQETRVHEIERFPGQVQIITTATMQPSAPVLAAIQRAVCPAPQPISVFPGRIEWSKRFAKYGSVHHINAVPIIGIMNNRREFLSLGLASFAAMAMFEQVTPEQFGINTLSTWDLPPINLNGWQATMRELTFPPGLESPKHTHPARLVGLTAHAACPLLFCAITLSTILGYRYSCSMPCTRFCESPDTYQKAAYQHTFRVCYLFWIAAKP